MKRLLAVLAPWLLTTLVVIVAITAGFALWRRYEDDPWTRDGHVRVDVVRVAPDVGGLVTSVEVHDAEPVHKGQLLFVVDLPRYRDALHEADARIASARAVQEQAERVARRDLALGDLVAVETHEENEAHVRTARAATAEALAARGTAALNVSRTSVYASVDGIVNNLDLHPGDYIAAGQQALAITDFDSLRVEGYFEETKLEKIHLGDRARVQLMGLREPLYGHVVGISSGIADDQSSNTANQLRQVNATFTWVRLAQRVPVRIHLDSTPRGARLIAGRTATVAILPGKAP